MKVRSEFDSTDARPVPTSDDDDFDALLEASSLGAPHVTSVCTPVPRTARDRMRRAVREADTAGTPDANALPDLTVAAGDSNASTNTTVGDRDQDHERDHDPLPRVGLSASTPGGEPPLTGAAVVESIWDGLITAGTRSLLLTSALCVGLRPPPEARHRQHLVLRWYLAIVVGDEVFYPSPPEGSGHELELVLVGEPREQQRARISWDSGGDDFPAWPGGFLVSSVPTAGRAQAWDVHVARWSWPTGQNLSGYPHTVRISGPGSKPEPMPLSLAVAWLSDRVPLLALIDECHSYRCGGRSSRNAMVAWSGHGAPGLHRVEWLLACATEQRVLHVRPHRQVERRWLRFDGIEALFSDGSEETARLWSAIERVLDGHAPPDDAVCGGRLLPAAGEPPDRREWTGTGVTTLSVNVEMRLLSHGQKGGGVRVFSRLTYRSVEPYAVEMLFYAGSGPGRSWTIARDLLEEGTRTPTGGGDVRVWSEPPAACTSPRDVDRTFIRLRTPAGQAVLTIPRDQLTGFLRQTERVVPRGAEHERMHSVWGELERGFGTWRLHDGKQ
jgi:hypothetical protein